MRILFVENHATFADVVSRRFLADHDVTVVSSLRDARAALDANFDRYELVLVDFDLDDGKGDALVREIRAAGRRVRVIGVSAREEGNAALLAAGADAICAKTRFSDIGDLLATKRGELIEPTKGAMLGTLIGDALGAPFEGTPAGTLDRLGEQLDRRDAAGGTIGYTDDGEMMIGVAESLVACGGEVVCEQLLATLAANHEPGRGYGKGVRRTFEAFVGGTPWHEAATLTWKEGSRGNGAAVRVAPVACLFAPSAPGRRSEAAAASASVTHAHPEAIAGTVLLAEAIALLASMSADRDLSGADFFARLGRTLPRDDAGAAFGERLARATDLLDRSAAPEEVVEALGHAPLALESVPAALLSFAMHPTSFEAAVQYAVTLGGDTDTIGAMAGALAGAYHGIGAIPTRWQDRLENGPRGRDHVVGLAERIAGLAPGR